MVLFYMESILLFFWQFLFYTFSLHELPILIFVILHLHFQIIILSPTF
jgi:hypothetical protein